MASSSSRKPKATEFSNAALWKRTDHPSKVSLFVGHGFYHERDNKPQFKFHMKKDILLFLQNDPEKCWVLVDEWPTLGPLKSVAVLGLRVVFTDKYDLSILQIWYLSIDIHVILLHMIFEDALSISVSKTRATCYKNLQLKTEKSQMCPLFFGCPPT
jgi:hypothetical protein